MLKYALVNFGNPAPMLKPFFCILLCSSLFLTACTQNNTPSADQKGDVATNSQPAFVGCYSVEKNSPAQILIKADNSAFSMQMKEPDGGWDTPEAMRIFDETQAWEFFKTNALGLNKADVVASLGREDEALVLAQIKSELVALNPSLDSPYVVSLFGAVNTIYQVACDNVGLELAVKDGIHQQASDGSQGGN